MTITSGDIALWTKLREMNAIPERPSVLEIGQANWFADVPLSEGQPEEPFAAAEWYYKKVLDYSRIVAIDMDGQDRALKLDLNYPVAWNVFEDCQHKRHRPEQLAEPFDIVINSGTLEHIFDVRQVLQTIHECCKTGGLMVHAVPVIGWLDHGFYCIQPTLFRDLAHANGYEILHSLWWDLDMDTKQVTDGPNWPGNWLMHVALRKGADGAFQIPQQGRYAK